MKRLRVGQIVYPLLAFILVIVGWEVYVAVTGVATLLLPSPRLVGAQLAGQWHILLSEGLYTLEETVLGFLLAALIAVPIAVALVYSRVLQRAIYPWLIASQSVPKIAIAPVVLLWLGIGTGSRVVIALLSAIFPIVIATATGLAATPPEMLDLSRALRASPWHTFWKVRFINALPHVFSGLKVATTLAVVGAVVGEFVAANHGLGHLILTSTAQAQTALAFAALVALSILGMLLFAAVMLAERLLVPWATPIEEAA
ncbi:MAG: ABC transporter permease [Nocardioidaceae bacterium]